MTTTDALFDAISTGNTTILDQILDADPTLVAVARGGVSPLRMAAYAGHVELVERLADRGAHPDAFDAAALGDVDRLRDLLDADADMATAHAGDGFTALHLAAWFGHVKAAELLLARGADPEAVASNDTGLRPLHSAAAGGHTTIAHLLLDRGADVDARQHGGITPLHSAAHRADTEMVALLLSRGADPTAATDEGRTAADLTTSAAVLALLP